MALCDTTWDVRAWEYTRWDAVPGAHAADTYFCQLRCWWRRPVVVDRRLNVSGLVAQAQIRGGSPHGGVTVVRSSRL